jgi:hypothetical protein
VHVKGRRTRARSFNQQITDFYINVAVLEAAQDKKLETLELWAFITSAIKGRNWTSFRLMMSMQKEYQSFWFIDQVREYILTLEDDRDTSPPSEGRRKSVSNTAQTSSGDSSSTDDLREVISKLAASVAAITTKAETASRVKNNKWGNDRPYDAKMGPFRFC